MNKLFFELIQVALHRRDYLSHTPSADEWNILFNMAKKQTLIGVCFAAIEPLHYQKQAPPLELMMKWFGIAEQIRVHNTEMNSQCSELQQRLFTDGIRSCVLKGQAIAKYYDDYLEPFRQSGDIDIWLDGTHRSIMEYVNSVSPTNTVRWLHTQMYVFEKTEVEAHFRPSYLECPWYDKSLQRFFDSERESCFSEAKCTDRFNQVFILAHAFRHFFSEGVGMRQLMDYYFVLKNSQMRTSHSEFAKVMSATGMKRFAGAVMWMMQYVFGLESEYLLCEPDEKSGRFLLDEVMQSGNFGHQDKRIKHIVSEGEFHRYCRIAVYNFRIVRFSPWIVVCSPIWRLWHWCWRKVKGYK